MCVALRVLLRLSATLVGLRYVLLPLTLRPAAPLLPRLVRVPDEARPVILPLLSRLPNEPVLRLRILLLMSTPPRRDTPSLPVERPPFIPLPLPPRPLPLPLPPRPLPLPLPRLLPNVPVLSPAPLRVVCSGITRWDKPIFWSCPPCAPPQP